MPEFEPHAAGALRSMGAARPVLSIVVPAYGEGAHLSGSLAEIRRHAAAVGVAFEMVIVDDGSPDDTWATLRALALRWPELRAVSLARNFGKEAAILAGLDLARGDAVILMDGDLQHPPELIPRMFALWREGGYKVVNARKTRRGDEPWLLGLGARAFYRLFAKLSGTDLSGAADFKLLDREVVDAYRRLPERNTFFRGIVPWLGFAQADIPFEVQARRHGRSTWSFARRLYLALDALSAFSTVPLQFVTFSGVAFLAFALVLAAQTLYVKLSGGAVEGFTTVILLTLVTGSILMLSLGVIGQYLARIYEEVKGRPRYLVRDGIRAGAAGAARSGSAAAE